MNIFDLPKEILNKILEYLTYDQVSKARLVCRHFDLLCQGILNRGFTKAIKQNNASFKRIKALLPRRESERRNHVLARHADILISIETRLSMLSMTYGKFIDLNLCCFIPGRVLDEVFSVLRLVANSKISLRPHEILQELRDISSMAIEHFDDKISNTLRKSCIENKAKSWCVNSSGDDGRITMANLTLPSPTGLGSISFRVTSDEEPPVFKTYNSDLLEASTSKAAAATSTPMNSAKLINKSQKGQQPSPLCSANAVCDDIYCSARRSLMTYCKKLEIKYKKTCLKMRRMQHFQHRQTKSLHQAIKSLCEFKLEILEMKKRLDEVDVKNREIFANMKQINPDSNDDNDNIMIKPSTSHNNNNNDGIIEQTIDSSIYAITTIHKRPALKRTRQSNDALTTLIKKPKI